MSEQFGVPFEMEKFQMALGGDFGIFYTDSKSPVFYINTSFEIDNIVNIKPVRDILDVSEVDFEELVQRDLDDFRIRRDIVNYLTDGMGYKFFPPIVAAITQPDESKKAIQKYYPSIKTRIIDGERKRFEIEFNDSFCIRWFLGPNDEIISLPTEIRWKPINTHLMAVDGQHRLVALQAIRGLISNERLKRFYINSTKNKNKLDHLKVPVTILFFPNSVEQIPDHDIEMLSKYFKNIEWNPTAKSDVKQVLRNIFVDVNKTARQPSKSRTILLDEKDLTSVFTRKIFASIKEDMPIIYTAVLEYNSQNGKETQIEKNRSIITTIGIVYNICEGLFKDSGVDDGANLRIRLGIDQVEGIFTSEEFPIEQLKSTEFSLEQRSSCEEQFEKKWLNNFKIFYTNLLPYKEIIDLVKEEYSTFKKRIENDDLNAAEAEAYRVLFGGSEERFILENLAKTNANFQQSLKLLKEIEKRIKENVNNYGTYYTMMFQKGFFDAVSELIQSGFLKNDHFATEDEFKAIVNHLNLFIITFSKDNFFINTTVLYNLIVGQKAAPEHSRFICDLIVLILIKFDPSKNLILKKEINYEIVASRKLDSITERIQNSLGKEFDSTTENRARRLDIKQLIENGDKTGAIASESKYKADKDSFIDTKFKEHYIKLKKQLGISE